MNVFLAVQFYQQQETLLEYEQAFRLIESVLREVLEQLEEQDKLDYDQYHTDGRVAEMADALSLNLSGEIRGGSIPPAPTNLT